ncbi:MAG TPA: hypothetical protein VLD39_18440 [Gammaproteobacteria bacterium]|nr:hypothetical protein [Gammaproteobacteria bacterium]
MKQERLYVIALLVLALLASIPQIPVDAQIWAALLALVGVASGVIVNYADLAQRAIIYIVALALPVVDNCLDAIWVVGPWVNMFLDHVATGIQGMAVGLFVMAIIARAQGTQPATR